MPSEPETPGVDPKPDPKPDPSANPDPSEVPDPEVSDAGDGAVDGQAEPDRGEPDSAG